MHRRGPGWPCDAESQGQGESGRRVTTRRLAAGRPGDHPSRPRLAGERRPVPVAQVRPGHWQWVGLQRAARPGRRRPGHPVDFLRQARRPVTGTRPVRARRRGRTSVGAGPGRRAVCRSHQPGRGSRVTFSGLNCHAPRGRAECAVRLAALIKNSHAIRQF